MDSGFFHSGACGFFRSGIFVFLLGQLRVHFYLEFAVHPVAFAPRPDFYKD